VSRATGVPTDVIWHDAECGSYDADLELWHQLAQPAPGPVLDLGCGTGRVALHLARREFNVVGVDAEAALIVELGARATGLPVRGVVGDARELNLGTEFSLALAPMQLVQLLADEAERIACLRGIAAHLLPGGIAALAIVEDVEAEDTEATFPLHGWGRRPSEPPPLPDTREVDGVIYSSLPLPTIVDGGKLLVRRLRQVVSLEGLLNEEESTIGLRVLSAEQLEREGAAAGLEPLPRLVVAPTPDHVGSTVVVLRKGGG
jgi:SAM-dependent methyltransferase